VVNKRHHYNVALHMCEVLLSLSACLSVRISQHELIRRWHSERELFYETSYM